MVEFPKTSKERQDVRHEVSFKMSHESVLSLRQDEVVNLSMGGLFFKTDRPLPNGTTLYMNLHIEESESPIKLVGSVAWSRLNANEEGPAGVGVTFVSLSPEERARLAKYLGEA